MNHSKTVVGLGIVAAVFVVAIPIPGKAASADGLALKEATITCRAQAKEQKLGWFASRKYVRNCVAKTVKLTPAEAAKVAVNHATVGCKAQAKGKKIGFFQRRKYVKECVVAALKDYSVDVSQVRKELKINELRVYTNEELGCRQNVFC
jgi:hypothetical protein